ncbi:MAG TPA: winged helix DNA-binding domain-containing protein [Chitinophagaceae bacterium]|nr:winged helix DNA-binding domain-containing protein [Chitinophagaceae bacterium]
MKITDILQHRLISQHITGTHCTKPEEIVQYLLAVQSQDYAMAKWAIGLRLPDSTEKMIDAAFDEGRILRTHVMRPTWHFVTPKDIRWLLALTAPRVHAINASYNRKTELDNRIFKRCHAAFEKALRNNNYLTRTGLQEVLRRARIPAEGIRLALIVMHAELEGLICSGPRQGKQFTYALLQERAPDAKLRARDEALAELTLRYFKTRGPATLADFAWWSGLTMKDVRDGVGMLGSELVQEKIEGVEYIFCHDVPGKPGKPVSTFLMPDYDEYGISYKDRGILYRKRKDLLSVNIGNAFFHMIVVDGVMGGTWKRMVKGKNLIIETEFFEKLNQRQQQAVTKSTKRYHSFFGNATEQ